MAIRNDLDVLCEKVRGRSLFREEEAVYMREILKIAQQEIDRNLAINDNKDPNTIIDAWEESHCETQRFIKNIFIRISNCFFIFLL